VTGRRIKLLLRTVMKLLLAMEPGDPASYIDNILSMIFAKVFYLKLF